jgi:hypothetical protein
MSRIHKGFGALGLMAAGFWLGGCSGSVVSAGSEGDAVNLNRCYGADCGVRAQSLNGAAAASAKPCGGVDGELTEPMRFEALGEGTNQSVAATEAPDGTVWAIVDVRGFNKGTGTLTLVRYASDGALLASKPLVAEADFTLIDTALTVDAAGIATVGLYSNYARTADSDVIEELTLYNFDANLQPVGTPRAFRGMATPQLATSGSSVWLAGNAFGNAAHGAISRVTNLEPDWIQTAVPTAGEGVGGVSGLTVADDGFAAVVARLNPKWSGSGPDVVKLGLAAFDAAGMPLWTLALPTSFYSGNQGAIGGTADGKLVVAGMVGDEGHDLRIQAVSREGELGWAYSLEGASGPGIEVRRDSGRTFAGAGRNLAVIDAAGETCRQFSIPRVPDSSTRSAWDPDGEYILVVGNDLTRLRVPE